MLRRMDSASLELRFGWTENCSMSSGQAVPMTMADSSMRTTARPGMRRSLITTAEKNAMATTMPMTIKMIFAGR